MRVVSKKQIGYFLTIIIMGVAINRLVSYISGLLGLPLYLDSVGTMFAAVLGGTSPGMFVGFITNAIGGISDTSTFYYGTINVLIALIAGYGADRGYFDKIYKIFLLLPFYLLLSIPCSLLTYVLFECQIGDNVAAPMANRFLTLGCPVLLAQILGDFCIELPDKLLSLLIAFGLTKAAPLKVRKEFWTIAGRDLRQAESGEGRQDGRSSLKRQVTGLLLMAGGAVVLVAFLISYKTYMEAKVAGYPDGNYDVMLLRKETLLYSGKMLSAVLGLLLCIVSLASLLANRLVVRPLIKLSKEMRRFDYDDDQGRDQSVAKIEALDIRTGNEIEELYGVMCKAVQEIDEYIDKTNEQSKTISELQVNIITTLADIVESRDETTGNHVKRTAAYAELLANELRREGQYTDKLTDQYIQILSIAAPLHDIGKIRIPDAILNKPGRLTDEEFEVIKTHTTLGDTMLDNAESKLGSTRYLNMAKHIALYHHEWWDGSKKGYPTGISGTDIPLSARIMAVADVLDALVSRRPYKEGYPLEKAFEIMEGESGTHFDPAIIKAMMNCKESIREIMIRYAET